MDDKTEKANIIDDIDIPKLIKDLDKTAKKLNEMNKELKKSGLEVSSPDTPIKF